MRNRTQYPRAPRGPRRPMLPTGMALTPRVASLVRGDRTQVAMGHACGLGERTIQRMEQVGATLTQALAMAGAELEAGDMQTAAYVLSMIGETLPLAPSWAHDRGEVGR